MPNAMFASAHHGVARGEPMYAICDQSKVTSDMPSPLTVPNSWFTTMLSGTIQHTQFVYDSAANRYPGRKYQQKDARKP